MNGEEYMRLDKLAANTGFGTRTEIKKFIRRGLITVNGEKAGSGSMQVNPEKDIIFVNGVQVHYQEFAYLMLNKPQDYISATEDSLNKTVLDLIDPIYRHMNLFPMGRLDKDTEGLLILTNDGQLAHRVLSPKKHVDKTYYVEVEGFLDNADVEKFNTGLDLGDFTSMPAKLKIIESGNNSVAEVIIKEGKYHQVKRMFEAVGKKVIFLKRIKMGNLELDKNLELGEYREISDEEIEKMLGN